jgi:hypothetical protein
VALGTATAVTDEEDDEDDRYKNQLLSFRVEFRSCLLALDILLDTMSRFTMRWRTNSLCHHPC